MTQSPYSPQPRNRILSGIQPTGAMTIGNYLGALRNWVALQDEYECLYCLVDQHALTVDQSKSEERLIDQCLSGAAALLACGIDAERHCLFIQSHNPDHVELGWYFTCTARMGWLNRMTQFKDKAGKNRENASTGLFVYPNLMAADILVYRATHVPVGEDQKQHLELTRDIAQRFNQDWQVPDYFPLIEPLILGEATRVMSLRDGTKKMSKSDPSDLSRINLSDSADLIAQKIRKAKTDPHALPDDPSLLEDRPEAKNLLTLYAAFADCSFNEAVSEFAGGSFSNLKQALAEVAVAKLAPITDAYNRYLQDKGQLIEILHKGAERARQKSAPVMEEVKQIMGLMTR